MRDDGAWEIDFDVPRHIPAGRYKSGWSVLDYAGNLSDIVYLNFSVLNDEEVDTEAPKVLEVKVLKTEYQIGETVTIMIRATDNLSLVTPFYHEALPNNCWAGLEKFYTYSGESNVEDANNFLRLGFCTYSFRHVDGDWYAIDFKLGANIPTGEYWLPQIMLSDSLGNQTYVQAGWRGFHERDVVYGQSTTKFAPNTPVVRFRVVR